MQEEDRFFIDLVGQIMDGFSEFEWRGRPLFIRHHTFREQAGLSRMFEQFKNDAEAKGIPNEERALKEACDRGDWTEKDEKFVKRQEEKIDALLKAVNKMKIPSQRETQMKFINQCRNELKDKKSERDSIIEHTAESLAYQKSQNRFMENILFKDKDFTLTFIEGEDCTDAEFAEIKMIQNSIYKLYTDANISKAVLRDFFTSFMPFTESPMDFLGVPVAKMTVFQIKLITYSRLFFNIFKNHHDLPDGIRQDPDAIIDYINANKNADANPANTRIDSDESRVGAETYFGANKEDIQKLKRQGQRVVSLRQELLKHGGKMDMKQMMRMAGDSE